DHPIRAAARELGAAEIEVVSDEEGAAGRFTLELRGDGRRIRAPHAPGRADFAFILASSGTTGRTKLVPTTHLQTLRYAGAARRWLEYSHDDVSCLLTPIHFANGLRSGLLNPLLAGLSIVCLPESDVEGFFRSIEQYRFTCLNAGFTLHRSIL